MHICRLEWRFNQSKEYLGWSAQDRVSNSERIHEGSELSNVIERRKRIQRCGDDDGRGIAPPTTPGILGDVDSTAARGIIQRQGCGPRKHIETRLLWLQAKQEGRKLPVVKEPTQTNTADGFTRALQTAKYLEWRSRLSMGYDNGDDVETSMREALAESGRWARLEALRPHPQC